MPKKKVKKQSHSHPKRAAHDLPTASNLQGPEAEIKSLKEDLRIAEQKIYNLTAPSNQYRIDAGKKRSYKFGLTSDWHIGSLYCNPEALVAFYKYAHKRGARDFFAAGDMLEGEKMYRGWEYEIRDVGFDKQLQALVEVTDQFPKTVKTHFVTGNHDASYAKQIGFDVGGYMARACRNMHCIGRDSAMITIETPSSDLRVALLHPDGGTAYALSYKSQKIIEAWEGGSKPHIIGIGHFHKAEFMPRYRNVKAIQAGCFQNQTPYMARKALAAHVGGWIVEIVLGELYNVVRTEFVEFF